MNSEELSGRLKEILKSSEGVTDAHSEIMSLLSGECWLKDTLTGVGKKELHPVKPIEVSNEP